MRKKLCICCGVCFFLFFIIFNNVVIEKISPLFVSTSNEDISCYDQSQTINSLLSFDADTDRFDDKIHNIFFHETSCFGNNGITLNARQACAVESAAKLNPDMTVYLLFLSNENFSNNSKSIIKTLMSYSNVKIRRIYMEKYIKNTPLEDWWASGVLKSSRWPRSHMSDILRYLTLWKYPGIYLDLDVVVISSLQRLTNFAGAEDWEDVAAGVLGFGPNHLGRRVADACLRDLKKNFRGDIWGNNGPGVITRTLQRLCSTKYAQDMSRDRCHGFTVYSPASFYPIHYKKWKMYFDMKTRNETLKLIENSMTIHVWNKLSQHEVIEVGSNAPYAIIANQYCPRIYKNSGKFF